MSASVPVRVYGLEVLPGAVPMPAHVDSISAPLRITMAAIDPSAEAQLDMAPDGVTPRATLKIIRLVDDSDDEEEDEDEDYSEDDDDIEAIERRLAGAISEEGSSEEDSDDEEEVNGGPSNPAKSKKAKRAAAAKLLLEALKDEGMDVDIPNGVNGTKSKKGKEKASDEEDEDDELDEDDLEGEVEEFVLCTLDPQKHYQQPLDITVNENERVYFVVSGTHSIYLTGNYIFNAAEPDYDMLGSDEDDLDYELGSDEDELDDEDEESDELDDLEDPRITEVDTDEEEAPKLIKADKKGKNKRSAEEAEAETNGLDDLINKASKSKKQKTNAGQAVATGDEKAASTKSDKKVQFAKNLEQGPTGSQNLNKKEAKKEDKKEDKKDAKPKPQLGVKQLPNGLKIDDRKLGAGPAAKNGDKIGMRYIGKLESNGKVFDANKKGKPFSFTLGKGEVIKGWDLGIAGMQVGSERRIIIPPALAYGSKKLPDIPANSTLVFDVKMISLS